MNKLQKKLKANFHISLWNVILTTLAVITFTVSIFVQIENNNSYSYNYYGSGYQAYVEPDRTLFYVLLAFSLIFFIACFVLWILGIVFATQINTMTDGENVLLIVFAVFPLWFINLIFAVMAKSKYWNHNATVSNNTINKDVAVKKEVKNKVASGNELQKKLNVNFHISLWNVILGTLGFVFMIMAIIVWSAAIVFWIIAVLLFIASFVLWIIGIVFAVKINTLTDGENVLLIVFAVFPMWFVNLIFAVMAKSKYWNHNVTASSGTNNRRVAAPVNAISKKEADLKSAFLNDIITSEEYERKRKNLK